MSLLPPTLLHEQDRRKEVAHLLAIGLLRRKIRLTGQENTENSLNSLDFRVFPSVHGHDEQRNTQGETDG